MTGVAKFNVVESPQRLKELMEQQKNALGFSKVQSLYFWKIGEVETVRHWESLKQELAWFLSDSLDCLREKVDRFLNSLSNKIIGTLTGWSWILQSLCMSGL